MLELYIFDRNLLRWRLRNAAEITGQLGGCTKADFIELMQDFPLLPIEPSTENGKLIKLILQTKYKDLCLWLRYYELGQKQLYSRLFFTELVSCKPDADLSVATLQFCKQLYPKSDWVQRSGISSPEQLWYLCHASNVLGELDSVGFWLIEELTPEPPENMGKRKAVEQARKAYQSYKVGLAGNELPYSCPEGTKIIKDGRNLVDALMHDAHRIIDVAADDDLEFHLKQFLRANAHYWREIDRSPELCIVCLDASGNITLSERGKKTPKFKGLQPKRGRGRPRKEKQL